MLDATGVLPYGHVRVTVAGMPVQPQIEWMLLAGAIGSATRSQSAEDALERIVIASKSPRLRYTRRVANKLEAFRTKRNVLLMMSGMSVRHLLALHAQQSDGREKCHDML